MTLAEQLRRLVLTSADGFSYPIRDVLRSQNLNVTWAKVTGAHVEVHVGAYEPDDPPDWTARLTTEVGGALRTRFVPNDDDYWVWAWDAPVCSCDRPASSDPSCSFHDGFQAGLDAALDAIKKHISPNQEEAP